MADPAVKTLLTIAGFDPSSGAGITADLMVFAAHRFFGTSCITALTVQSTLGVAATHPVDPGIVQATLDHLHVDLPPAGIKIGMLATPEVVRTVADYLDQHLLAPVVLDPVMRSSSGRELLSPAGVTLLRERLLPRATWVTPNIDELGILTGRPVTTWTQMRLAAHALQKAYPGLTVLATGGHLDPPDDLLVTPDGREYALQGELIATSSTHGTGCVLSSALLCRIAAGDEAHLAASGAKEYVAGALRAAVSVGHGRGPVNPLWRCKDQSIPG